MTKLQSHGVTVEDLEQAASIRLFEKAAAAEGINLAELDDNQLENLYSAYQNEESTMNEEIVDLFEKQAAYEGIDLEAASDEELKAMYENFVHNLSAQQENAVEEQPSAEEISAYLSEKTAHVYNLLKEVTGYDDTQDLTPTGGSILEKRASIDAMRKEAAERTMLSAFDAYLQENHNVASSDLDESTFVGAYNEFLDNVANNTIESQQEEADAQEKLAEAEILGRHMARAYMDELQKEASEESAAADAAGDAASAASDASKGAKKGKKGMSLAGAGRAAKAVGGTALAASLMYGGKKMYDKHKASKEEPKQEESEKSASSRITDIAVDRANQFIEFGKEAGYDGSLVDQYALEILEGEGYDLTPLYE